MDGDTNTVRKIHRRDEVGGIIMRFLKACMIIGNY